MRRWAVVFLLFSALLPEAASGSGIQQAKLAFHVAPHPTKSLYCSITLPPCSQFATRGSLRAGQDAYVVIAEVPVAAGDGIAGATFGIDYDNTPSQGLDILWWRMCADGLEFPVEGPHGEWPSAGSGNRLTWMTCQDREIAPDGVHAVAGFFYVYAYDADHLRITDPPGFRLTAGSCAGETAVLPASAGGIAAFVAPASADHGFNPCLNASPICSVPERYIEFGSAPVGGSLDIPVSIRNQSYYQSGPLSGTAEEDCPEFAIVSGSPYYLEEPGDTGTIVVRIAPTTTGPLSCILHLGSDCGDVVLEGAGVVSSHPELSPMSVFQHLDNDGTALRSFSVANTGGDPLLWKTHVELGTLESIQAAYVLRQTSIRAKIPNRYNFNGGSTGASIGYLPGGPYESGNMLSTDLGGDLEYTNGRVRTSAFLGGGRYFTRKDLGIFLFVGDLVGVNQFSVRGTFLAPMGDETVEQMVVDWNQVSYRAIVHRFSGNPNYPSVNHVFITPDPTFTVQHTGGRSEDVSLSGIGQATRLFYLLYMGAGGASIDTTASREIVTSFLSAVHPYPQWAVSSSGGSTSPGGTETGELFLSARGLAAGIYNGHLAVQTNSFSRPVAMLPITLEVSHVPDISITPSRIEFDSVFVDDSAQETLAVSNEGLAPLDLQAGVESGSAFSVDPAQLQVGAGGSGSLVVRFQPYRLGPDLGTLILRSNDPDEDTLLVDLVGFAPQRPEILVDPPAIIGTAVPGGRKQKSLLVGNAGPTRLVFDVDTTEPWLLLPSPSGALAPGRSIVLDVVLDAGSLDLGDFQGMLFVHSNAQTRLIEIPVTFHVASVDVRGIDVEPNTLNPGSQGRWVRVFVELPAGDEPEEIVLETVLAQGQVPCEGFEVGDHDVNGVTDLGLRFPRDPFIRSLPALDRAEVFVSGEIRDRHYFVGRDSVRVLRPHLVSPNGGERLLAATFHDVVWDLTEVPGIDSVAVFCSPDGGITWNPVGSSPGGTRLAWRVPEQEGGSYLLSVHGYRGGALVGYDISDGVFAVTSSTVGIDPQETPSATVLFQNAPNPFCAGTRLAYRLAAPGAVALEIFNVSGMRVRTLMRAELPAGDHEAWWDGHDDAGRRMPPGLYVARLRTPTSETARRMFLVP